MTTLAGNRGYRAYRGKSSGKKGVLAVFLVLVILAAVGVVFLQKYIVYDKTGAPHLEVPWQEETPPEPEEPVELDLVIQPIEAQEEMRGYEIPAGRISAESCAPVWETEADWNAVAVVLKDSRGTVYYDSAVATYNTAVLAEDTAETLGSLTEADLHTIAKISCFHDPKAANGDVDGMGLKNLGGYIFYDGNNSQWLDPAKEAARQYLCGIAEEAAKLRFKEILLTDVSYPTEGSLDKIAYGVEVPAEQLEVFLREVEMAVEPYGVKLSVEVPAEVLAPGWQDTDGLVLEQIAPAVDRIYAAVPLEESVACAEAVASVTGETEFVPILHSSQPLDSGSFLAQ